jgi:ketosteroid isomerase-like protein
MTDEHVDALREVYARWGQGDFSASLEVADPLILFVIGTDFPDAGTYLGFEGLRKYTRGFLEPWTSITIEAEEITPAGDSVVVGVLQRGVGGESGAATEFRYFHVWSFRGPKAIRLENFRERAEAFEAVGAR